MRKSSNSSNLIQGGGRTSRRDEDGRCFPGYRKIGQLLVMYPNDACPQGNERNRPNSRLHLLWESSFFIFPEDGDNYSTYNKLHKKN